MEADWEIEIAPDAPVIDAAWEGYVDLRQAPVHIVEIREADQLRTLADTLIRLNSPSSPVWTVKCDVWPVDGFDPDELDADPKQAAQALGCYIDLIPVCAEIPSPLDAIVDWCRQLCLRLRSRPLRQSRVDTIVRRALITSDTVRLGITAYVTACGSSAQEAEEVLSSALDVLADSVLAIGSTDQGSPKYNQDIVGE
jgi:hypothetical protein